VGILLQPKIRKQYSDTSILLTGNYNAKDIDSLTTKYPGAELFNLVPAKVYRGSKAISSVHNIPTEKIKIVVGDGLNSSALDVFGEQSLSYISNPEPTGITNLIFPKIAQAQTKSTITGEFNNLKDSTKLILEGPGGKEDSVMIRKTGPGIFNLSFTPKQKGNFAYSISVNGEKEILPVSVKGEKQMDILIIQMFPTFETGYLKNLLAKNHSLVLRYQLSKNNFRYEYINHKPVKTERITPDMLNEFDLVIIDSDVLSTLSASERNNLSESTASGLGTLILFNELPKSNNVLKSVLPVSFKPYKNDTAKFLLGKDLTLAAWPIEPINNGEIIPTITNKDRILAGYVYQGFGKVGFQIFQQTYKLALEGDSTSYSILWTTILQRNARTPVENYRIHVKNEFPVFPGEPLQIEITSSSSNLPTLIHDGIEIPLTEDATIDDLWRTKVWPDKAGWHELQIKGDSTKQSYFVSESGWWKSLATSNSIRNTKALASVKQIKSEASWIYAPFGNWIFFGMFILAATTLWLIPKL
jgi:hypothetical protein